MKAATSRVLKEITMDVVRELLVEAGGDEVWDALTDPARLAAAVPA